MAETLEFRYDKFVFRVPQGLRYSVDDLWVRWQGNRATLGMTDFLQQKSGDAAFVELVEVGTRLSAGDELGELETVKATVALKCPVSGMVVAANEDLELEPERVNQDPYGDGWLAIIALDDPAELEGLLGAAAYLALLATKVEGGG